MDRCCGCGLSRGRRWVRIHALGRVVESGGQSCGGWPQHRHAQHHDRTSVMRKLLITALFLSPASVWAQPAIAPPRLGFVEDSTRALRPAFGVSGSFILGPSVTLANAAGQIVTEAFSGSFGLLKTDSSLAAFSSQGKILGSIDAAPGPAFFAFSPNSATALAYIASSKALIEWRGTAFAPVSVPCDQA